MPAFKCLTLKQKYGIIIMGGGFGLRFSFSHIQTKKTTANDDTVVFCFCLLNESSYLIWIAPVGQVSVQPPQATHSDAST